MLTDNPGVPLILVVEDDDSHAELIKRSFDNVPEAYRLKFAGCLRDAHKLIDQQLPNLIVTDYRLPDGDGNELMHRVNGDYPVVLMTSQGSEQVAVDAMKSGAQDYIVKSPVTIGHLPETAKYALKTWSLIQSRKQADEAVRRAKREWEQTFDAVPDLIAIVDTSYTVIRANRAMAERCGFKPEELIGRKCHELMHCSNAPAIFCPHARMLQDGRRHGVEAEIKEMGGFFDISVSPLYDADGCLCASVHVIRDITERKQAEETRLELERQFQQTQKLESIGVLAGGIAHDFNNILTIILGHCYIVKEDSGAGMTNNPHIRQIESAASRAADLCRQMLVYAGRSQLVQSHVNLPLLIDEMSKMLTSAIKKNVSIELDLSRDIPEITGDNSQIQQVVMNLIINAAEAIGDANGCVRVTLKHAAVPPEGTDTDFFGATIPAGRYACLEVNDTGCGMDEEIQQRIFEPFYTTKFAGRGLGMSAILGIIKSHNAALKLSSTPGVGTSFKIYFPLPDTPLLLETLPQDRVNRGQGSGTVLLVDDEEALRTIGIALLSAMGFSVVVAANGREALEIFTRGENIFNLVLLDLIMPVMDGIETYHELRKLSPYVPVVICSGYGDDDLRDVIELDMHAEFIQKPYKPFTLLETFNRIMG